MINILVAALFGLMEGVTEWLPISSTAHMEILNHIIPLNVSPEFYEVFEVVIQLGAILALFLIFFNKVWPFGINNKNPLVKRGPLAIFKKDKFFLWLKIAVSCIPVIIYELVVKDYVNIVNDTNRYLFIGVALITVGVIFVIIELALGKRKPKVISTKDISFEAAFVIGVCQLVAAVFPGVSRSGSTIIAGLLLGLSRTVATEYTYELAIPVMFGASLMTVIKFEGEFVISEIIMLLVGCLVAFIVSLFMIRLILNYLKKHDFKIFGIYRVLIGIVVLFFLA